MLLKEGEKIPKNLELGIEYIRKSANSGYEPAMYHLYLLLQSGDEVPIDEEESLNYLSKAVENRHVEAMCKYAIILRKKNNSKAKILEQSKDLLAKACYKGNAESLYHYGMMY